MVNDEPSTDEDTATKGAEELAEASKAADDAPVYEYSPRTIAAKSRRYYIRCLYIT